jgi:ABC-2 type transport system ATP-binding protein
MDEAERCHRISYISMGRMLAVGTADEVIKQSGLVTYTIKGPRLATVAEELAGKDGVEQVAPFGNSLHVVGHDARLLQAALAPIAKDQAYETARGETSLEDVFIQFMAQPP